MKLADARISLGRDINLHPFQSSTLDSIRRMLDKYRVRRAFLSSFASFRFELDYGNGIAFEAAAQDERLVPCPTVMPDSGDEVGDEERFVRGLVKRGARCVGFYPKAFGLALDREVIGGLFQALEKRRLPVAIPAAEVELPAVALLATEYPRLPVLYVSPLYRHRNLLPALRTAPNLHLVISPPFAPNEGLEWLVERFGSDRFLYGSDFPAAEPGATLAWLLHSRLKGRQVADIAWRNMQRLIEGVRGG